MEPKLSGAKVQIGIQPWMADPAAEAVMDALDRAQAGGARFVGGAVRNTLMGKAADDVDIATVLTPPAVIKALSAAGLKSVPTGVEYGTVTAISGGRPFEVTTLRRDVETDGRRAVVAYTHDWAQDAQRRDFRFNALYADRTGAVFDPVGGGVEDAMLGRVVFVGDAAMRLAEDNLRILRFFRFHAWYGRGDPDVVGLAACTAARGKIGSLSAERVGKEMLKLFAAPDPRATVALMIESGVMAEIFAGRLDVQRFESLVQIDADPVLRLAALLADPSSAADASARLRLSNAQRDRLCAAVEEDETIGLAMSAPEGRAAIYRLGRQAFCDRLLLSAARTGASAGALLSGLEGWSAPELPVTGKDVIAAGFAAGPDVGEALRRAEAAWIESDFTLDKESLVARLHGN